MNYRHAFHAGSFADVFKHVVLTRVLLHLRDKPAPFRVIDTHAGAGLYDLAGDEASRTGEWRDGIGRLAGAILPDDAARLIAPYLAAVRQFNPDPARLRRYPGSPLIAAHLLRPADRVVACELEPGAAAALSGNLKRFAPRSAKAIRIDGWTALHAYVPPPERRGVVMVDPPFERADDFQRLAREVTAAHRKWPTGTYLLWYPVKEPRQPDRLAAALGRAGLPKVLLAELAVAPMSGEGLNACGALVINPPWTLAGELDLVLPFLADVLRREAGGGWMVRSDEIPPERAAGEHGLEPTRSPSR